MEEEVFRVTGKEFQIVGPRKRILKFLILVLQK